MCGEGLMCDGVKCEGVKCEGVRAWVDVDRM